MPCCGAGKEQPIQDPRENRLIPKSDENCLKMIVVGDSGVGKTRMLFRLLRNEYDADLQPTVGVDLQVYPLEVEERAFKIMFWDTAGQERFNSVAASYYRDSHTALVVYDAMNQESYLSLPKWLRQVKNQRPHAKIVIIGCKSDLITEEESGVEFVSADFEKIVGSYVHFILSSKTGNGFKTLKKCLADIAAEHLRQKRGAAYQKQKDEINSIHI